MAILPSLSILAVMPYISYHQFWLSRQSSRSHTQTLFSSYGGRLVSWYVVYLSFELDIYHTFIGIMPRSIRPFHQSIWYLRTDHPSDQPESISSTPKFFFFKAAPSQKERKADRKTCSTYTKLTQVERFIHRLASTSLYLTSQGPMDIQEYLKHSSLSTSSYPTSTFTLRRRENIFYQDFKEQWHP